MKAKSKRVLAVLIIAFTASLTSYAQDPDWADPRNSTITNIPSGTDMQTRNTYVKPPENVVNNTAPNPNQSNASNNNSANYRTQSTQTITTADGLVITNNININLKLTMITYIVTSGGDVYRERRYSNGVNEYAYLGGYQQGYNYAPVIGRPCLSPYLQQNNYCNNQQPIKHYNYQQPVANNFVTYTSPPVKPAQIYYGNTGGNTLYSGSSGNNIYSNGTNGNTVYTSGGGGTVYTSGGGVATTGGNTLGGGGIYTGTVNGNTR